MVKNYRQSIIDDLEKRSKKPFDEDVILFLPFDEIYRHIKIETRELKDRGEPFMGAMGHIYSIILYRLDKDGKEIDKEMFEAVLISPFMYITHMIKEGWFGVVCKKTTTSISFIERIMADIS